MERDLRCLELLPLAAEYGLSKGEDTLSAGGYAGYGDLEGVGEYSSAADLPSHSCTLAMESLTDSSTGVRLGRLRALLAFESPSRLLVRDADRRKSSSPA